MNIQNGTVINAIAGAGANGCVYGAGTWTATLSLPTTGTFSGQGVTIGYASETAYWQSTFAGLTPSYYPTNTVIEGNIIEGGYYAVELLASYYSTVQNNLCVGNTRGIVVSECSYGNHITTNRILNNISTGIMIGYMSSGNTVLGNKIIGTTQVGEGQIVCEIGSTYNTVEDNDIFVAAGAGPQYYLYNACGSSNNVFKNNRLAGPCANAYVGVETAWLAAWTSGQYYAVNQVTFNGSTLRLYTCTTAGLAGGSVPTGTGSGISDGVCVWTSGAVLDSAHHGTYSGVPGNVANTLQNAVEVTGNTITGTSAVPAIFESQITDGVNRTGTSGNSTGIYLTNGNVINNNTIIGTTYSYQLDLLEMSTGELVLGAMKNNSFDPGSTQAMFNVPRGRNNMQGWGGNVAFDLNIGRYSFPLNSTTPSVAVGSDFVTSDNTNTAITSFTNMMTGQQFSIRCDTYVGFTNSGNLILKGLATIAPGNMSSSQIISFEALSTTIAIERARNF